MDGVVRRSKVGMALVTAAVLLGHILAPELGVIWVGSYVVGVLGIVAYFGIALRHYDGDRTESDDVDGESLTELRRAYARGNIDQDELDDRMAHLVDGEADDAATDGLADTADSDTE